MRPELFAAYFKILCAIIDNDGPMLNDEKRLKWLLNCSMRKSLSLRNELIQTGKIYLTFDDKISGVFADREIAWRRARHQLAVENGSKGGQKRVENERKSRNFNNLGQAELKHRARETNKENKETKESGFLEVRRVSRSRQPALWAECERINGKPAPTDSDDWAFGLSVVEEAELNLNRQPTGSDG